MAIPSNISREYILKAIEEIDLHGVPAPRKADRYLLKYQNNTYPVKYIISIANVFANGRELNPDPGIFNTYMAQRYLKDKGFQIVDLNNNDSEKYNGFKVVSLELRDNSLLGKTNIVYNFIDENDNQEAIYSTVIIGVNGTGKSNLFRIIIELFKEINDLKNKRNRSYQVDGQFNLKYSINDEIFEYSNIRNVDKTRHVNAADGKLYAYLLRNGEIVDFTEALLPDFIVANSIMLTDKYPVYIDETIFPIYKYLGVRNKSQNASTRSYVRKTIEFVVQQFDSSMFRHGLSRSTAFLGIGNAIEIFYYTSNAPKFFTGYLTPKNIDDYFQDIKKRYANQETQQPFKLTQYLKLVKTPNAISDVCAFCNRLVQNNKLTRRPKSSIRKLTYNIIDEKSFQSLKEDFEMLEQLRQLGMLTAPEIQLQRLSSYPLQESSSGEYHFFSSIVGLMATVKPNSLILIDEPEISLHPNWQMQYLSFVRELFSGALYSTSHLIIATHSHFIISDLEGKSSKIIGLKRENEKIETVTFPAGLNTFGWSAEDVLYNIFNVRSSLNYYLQADLTELLGMISNDIQDVLKIEGILGKLEKLPKRKNDPLQEIIFEARQYLNSIR